MIHVIKIAGDSTVGCAEAFKTIFPPANFTTLGLIRDYRTIASLTTKVDDQPMTPLQQLTDIRARLTLLEDARDNGPTSPHNPALFFPVRPTAPALSPLVPRRR